MIQIQTKKPTDAQWHVYFQGRLVPDYVKAYLVDMARDLGIEHRMLRYGEDGYIYGQGFSDMPRKGTKAYKAWIVKVVAKDPSKRTTAEKNALAEEFSR